MLQIKSFSFNPFAENTLVVYDSEKRCCIIDPGMSNAQEENIFMNWIKENNLQPQFIINTHAHIDHILGVNFVKDIFNIPFLLHPEEAPILHNAVSTAMMFGLRLDKAPVQDEWITAQEFKLGDETIEIKFTPGHSPGSISFYYPKGDWVIGGDVLFERSIGRTDLPLGDFATLKKSILEQLYVLPPQTIVYPGHGAPTTIGIEMKENPFVPFEP